MSEELLGHIVENDGDVDNKVVEDICIHPTEKVNSYSFITHSFDQTIMFPQYIPTLMTGHRFNYSERFNSEGNIEEQILQFPYADIKITAFRDGRLITKHRQQLNGRNLNTYKDGSISFHEIQYRLINAFNESFTHVEYTIRCKRLLNGKIWLQSKDAEFVSYNPV